MIFTYKECLQRCGSKYNMNKMIASGEIFKQEKGIYSDVKYVPEYQIISAKYPKAVFSLDSAFYYHGLTDVIPDKYYLTTEKSAAKIKDPRVVQIFENSDVLHVGAKNIPYGDTKILMYTKERMLVELLRKKNKLQFDYYKEILGNYRKIIYELDVSAVQNMIMMMPKTRMIMEALELEVF